MENMNHLPARQRHSLVLVAVLSLLLVCFDLLGRASIAAEQTMESTRTDPVSSAPFVLVLGVAQDAGIPQAGAHQHPAWQDDALKRLATSLGLVDPNTNQYWLFEATPDLRLQYFALDTAARQASRPSSAASSTAPSLAGILLTHAHIGHYSGLMFLGHESMGADDIVVHAMPRMRRFLENNGPWDQLLRYGNIQLEDIHVEQPIQLNQRLQVTALPVPHRQEYSEVVGYRIQGPQRSVLFLPDIDSWQELDSLGTAIETWIASVDVAYLDGTFYANGEIPGRDMSGFPHPFITHSMHRFSTLPDNEKAKVHFIHFNHTNMAARAASAAEKAIEAAGFHVARQGDRLDL